MPTPLYMAIARALDARNRCDETPDHPWSARWRARLKAYADALPRGSGWDGGTTIDDASTPERLVLSGSFHHMDEHGGYDGWTEHTIIVTPSLRHHYTLRVTGRDRNGIKEYLGDLFSDALAGDAYEPEAPPL